MVCYDQDIHDAPDVRMLWDRVHVARVAGRKCDCCREEILPGEKYESRGYTEDGRFQHDRCHYAAYQYPTGCPKGRARDLAEIEEQFRRDEELWAPPMPTAGVNRVKGRLRGVRR